MCIEVTIPLSEDLPHNYLENDYRSANSSRSLYFFFNLYQTFFVTRYCLVLCVIETFIRAYYQDIIIELRMHGGSLFNTVYQLCCGIHVTTCWSSHAWSYLYALRKASGVNVKKCIVFEVSFAQCLC